jgi:hypothetical protein
VYCWFVFSKTSGTKPRLVFRWKVPNFVYQKMSRLGVVRDPPHILNKVYSKKICRAFFEISAHSASYLWLSLEICSF